MLSLKARKAIAAAQRERWAKHHALQAANGREAFDMKKRRKQWRSAKRKQRSDAGQKHIRKPGQTSNPSKAAKTYWAMKTPKQRSEEMMRRIKVREANRKAAAAAAAA